MGGIKPLQGGQRSPRAARRAYTLAEIVVSLGAASLLLTGVGSTIYVASRATQSTAGEVPQVVAGSMTADQMMAELRYAITFNERTATAVEFTIADRTGDSSPEVIRYQWSGIGGDPLTRQYNAGAPQEVASDVHQFALDYQVKTVSDSSSSGGSSQSGETLLAHFDGWSGVSAVNFELALAPNTWMSEYFQVDWPTGATEVDITRVRLQLWKELDSGQITVGIYPASGGGPLPGTTPLGTEVAIATSDLPTTAQWVDVTFTDVKLTDPNIGYNIVVKGLASGAKVRYLLGSTAPTDTTVAKWTFNGGTTWNPNPFLERLYDVPFNVFGTHDAGGTPPASSDRYFVRSVGITLQMGDDSASRLHTATEVLNAPEVAAP